MQQSNGEAKEKFVGFSPTIHLAAQRGERRIEVLKDTITGLFEPFYLLQNYPDREVVGDNGIWTSDKQILPHQLRFHENRSISDKIPKARLISGGVGAGKSVSAMVEAVRWARTEPGVRILITSAYDYFLEEFTLPTFWGVCPLDDNKHIQSYNAKQKWLWFTNGSYIRFRAYDEPDKIRGFEVHRIIIEEAAEMGDGNNDKARQIFQNLLMRLRCTSPRYPLQMVVVQNPKGHNWVWKVFVQQDKSSRQPLGDSGRKVITGKRANGDPIWYAEFEKTTAVGDVYQTIAVPTYANTNLPPTYESTLADNLSGSPELQKRMIEGLFNPINMLVFEAPNYSEDTHLVHFNDFCRVHDIDPEDGIPYMWPVCVGIDPAGMRSPWAIEYFTQPPGYDHWVCFDEVYEVGLTLDMVAHIIIQREKLYGWDEGHAQYFIDPVSSQQKNYITGLALQKELLARGINTALPKGYTKYSAIYHTISRMRPNRLEPCPYSYEEPDGEGIFEVGKAGLYFLTGGETTKILGPDGMPAKDRYGDDMEINSKGHFCPGLIAELSTYRMDSTKQRALKESEEGLKPVITEKVMDRDDHGITAMFFFLLGKFPPVKGDKRMNRGAQKKPYNPNPYNRYSGHTTRDRKRGVDVDDEW